MKKSTRSMLKMHGWRLDLSIHNYIYFVFYYPYVKTLHFFLPLLKRLSWCKPVTLAGRFIFNRYHAKVLSLQDTTKILTLDHDVSNISEANKQIIPFKYATKIIFQHPEHIAVMDCPCKKSTGAAKEDINSCIAVGLGITTFWMEHCQKYHPQKITQQEALDLVKHFRRKNHITQAFFKGATGGRTGVICNCHPDTCVSLQATKYSKYIDDSLSMSAESGYSVKHSGEFCMSCDRCIDHCHFEAIARDEKGLRTYDSKACMGCGLCIENCSGAALELIIDPKKSLPLDLDKIENQLSSPSIGEFSDLDSKEF